MWKPIQVASIVTPVPGGVGPCTVACLMQNTLLGKDYTFLLSIKGTGSPVPGGVGPCTVACHMQNTLLGKDYTFVFSIKGTGSRDDYFLQAHKVESLFHVRLRGSCKLFKVKKMLIQSYLTDFRINK
jgi:hypothetical protein